MTNRRPLTFDHWRNVPETFATRRQWLRRGRKVRPDMEPTARLIYTYEAPPDCLSSDEVWLDDPDLCLLVDQEVPLYHADQTVPIQQTPRTLAYLAFEDIFLLPAIKDAYIHWNPQKPNARHPGQLGDWETIIASGNDFLSEAIIRRHINQRTILGVKAGPTTRFLALDHDFHGRDRDVYLDQAEVLLDHFHGDGWHYQVAEQDIDGMHYFRIFESPRELRAVRWMLRQQLRQLDADYPDLAARAKAADMKTLRQLEIYPSQNTGFRLPLCRGRQMLLDRPLPPVVHHKRQVQDVERYIGWLQDPQRQYMAKESIQALLWHELASAQPKKASPSISSVAKQPGTEDGNGLGKLTGCCRQKLTAFWNGTFNPPKSLNQALIVTARILSFEGVAEARACDLLRHFTSALPLAAHGCSDRLMQGDTKAVDRCILRAVKLAYDGNKGQADADMSTAKLQQAVACWQRGGFRLSDTSTWGNCWARYAAIPDVPWTESDARDINLWLRPALGKSCPASALDIAQGMVKLAAVKHLQENGIEYKYWQMFLNGEFGVACGNRNKLHGILRTAQDLNLLEVHSSAIWFADSRKGFATIYCPGKRVADRIVVPTTNTPSPPTP